MERSYAGILQRHFLENRQMAFVSGPRQVGKTTLARSISTEHIYRNWDNQNDRQTILSGPDSLARDLALDQIWSKKPIVVLDELHKYRKWKQFTKGFFDSYGDRTGILINGSARLNIYRKTGDSLMGRFFHYRLHPLSVAEVAHPVGTDALLRPPARESDDVFQNLMRFGGFPEPFIRAEQRFFNKWSRLRHEQLFQGDLRDLGTVSDIALIETLARIVTHQSGQLVNYTTLSKQLNVAVDTVRRWLGVLGDLYFSFPVRPYFPNVPKALRRQPKVYLWDWSLVENAGQRAENMVAQHLLKAVHFWTDNEFGSFDLHFLRDKQKREVDFLITREAKPWILIEVKQSATGRVSPALKYYADILPVDHAFQVELDASYVDHDCFAASNGRPIRVPGPTLLSQLV
ncbi:MAG: ATP-binding protein [Spirochaetaceae bacterium]